MPFVHGKSTSVILGGTDVSSFLNSVDQTITRDVSESSTFGAQAKSYVKGHKDGTISLSGYWDGASGAIDSVMASALGNEVLGYGAELLPAGDAVGNYTVSGVTAAVTPLPGFTASIYFVDNLVTRTAFKSVSVIQGTRYVFQFYIQLDSGALPIAGTTADAGADFRINIGTNVTTAQTLTTFQLISGSLYLASFVFTANATAATEAQIAKFTGQSSRAFRIAGLSLRAVATVQQTRQVDTYGPELLTAGELLTDYPNRSNVSQAVTPIAGFTNSVYFQDNSTTRFAYKYFTPVSGQLYQFSAIVQMEDGSIPVIGPSTISNRDFLIALRGTGGSAYGYLTERIGANIYRVSALDSQPTTNINFGIQKNTLYSAKPFKVSGYSLRQVTYVTVPTAPPLSICESGTSTAGLRALVVQAHDTSYQVTGTTGDTVAVSCEFQVDGSFGSGAFRGVVLAPLATYSTGTNTTAVDNGSTTFGGLVANFHVLSNAEWVTMKIQHSTDNSTWVDLLTSTSFSQNSSEHLVTPNVIYRYLRVNITASGSTTPRLIVTAARK